MKKGIVSFLIVFILFSSLAFAATPFNSSTGYHPLQQVTTDQTGTTSVDANSNGVIDQADTATAIGDTTTVGNGLGNAILSLKGATTLWSAIDFYSGNTAYWGVGRNANDNKLYIDRFGVGRVITIDPTTLNVGIGTTNPIYNLDIKGGEARIGFNTIDGRSWMIGTDYSPSGFHLLSNAGGSKIFVSTAGNVGIGTVSPAGGQILHTYQPSSDLGVRFESQGGWIGLGHNNAGQYAAINYRTSGTNYWDTVVFKNGNVGIGTTSPAVKFHISETGAHAYQYITAIGSYQPVIHLGSDYGGAGVKWGTITVDTLGNLKLLSGGSLSSPGISVNPSGNVGIGTVSPVGTLHVKAHNNGWDGGLALTTSDGSRTFRIHPEISNGYGLMFDGVGQGFYFTGGTVRASSMTDLENGGYYVDPASTSNENALTTNTISTGYLDFRYAGGNSGRGNDAYAIFQEGGAWTHPYPDLRIAYHTGIKLGANPSYNGIRFYNDYDMSGLVMAVNDAATGGANNVYIPNLAYIGDTRTRIMYDWDNTGYYVDPASTSRINAVVYDNLYSSGSSAYGLLGINVYVDTINTGSSGDPLEINYYRQGDVRIGNGPAGRANLYVYGDIYSDTFGWISSAATHRGEGTNYVDYSRYVYNNGAYSGSGWVEPSDLGVRYASSSAWASNSGYSSSSGYASSAGSAGSINGVTGVAGAVDVPTGHALYSVCNGQWQTYGMHFNNGLYQWRQVYIC